MHWKMTLRTLADMKQLQKSKILKVWNWRSRLLTQWRRGRRSTTQRHLANCKMYAKNWRFQFPPLWCKCRTWNSQSLWPWNWRTMPSTIWLKTGRQTYFIIIDMRAKMALLCNSSRLLKNNFRAPEMYVRTNERVNNLMAKQRSVQERCKTQTHSTQAWWNYKPGIIFACRASNVLL